MVVSIQPSAWNPPSSPTAYMGAMQGHTETAEGDLIATANIGGHINHAPLTAGYREAVKVYENTAAQTLRVRFGEVLIDFLNLRADRQGRDLHLTRREFDLLFYLAERRGLVVHRSELLREIWGYPTEPVTRAVDYAIKRLRTKIEVDPHNPRYITTVHGDGYSLTFDDSEA